MYHLKFLLTLCPCRTWTKTEASPGVYTWDNVDQIYKYAQVHKLAFRGHGIVGYETSPDWLLGLNATEMRKAIYNHSYNTVKRYPKMASVVVVNEPMSSDGTGNLSESPMGSKLI